MELSEIRLIDRKTDRCDKFSDPIAMRAELNSHGVLPDEQALTEALRIKRILLCESEDDSQLLSCLASNYAPDWSKVEKQYQVITTQGANDNVVARMQAVVEILNTLLNGGVHVAYLRDRDLMSDERKEEAEQKSIEQGLTLVITHRRNRESYLVEPKVIEEAVLSQGAKIPAEWSEKGVVAELVKDRCLEFCNSQRDELPGKVRDYNRQWIGNKFPEEHERRSADTRLETFIRENWHDKIQSNEIPWKLMDGHGALKFVRQKLQEKSIILPDSVLLKHLSAAPLPEDFRQLIDVIRSWN